MSAASLSDLQSTAARLSVEPRFAVTGPAQVAVGGGWRELPARPVCHLFRDGHFVGIGLGATDAEALEAALSCFRARVVRIDAALREIRARGVIACAPCFDRHPHARGCAWCERGECEEVHCAYCDEPSIAAQIACQCGDPVFALCTSCETDSRHLAQFPRPITCRYGSGPPPGLCGAPAVPGTPWCPEHREWDRIHALGDRRGYGVEIG